MKNIKCVRQRLEEKENCYRQQPRQEGGQREGGGHYRDSYRYGEAGAQRPAGGRGSGGLQRGYEERFDSHNRYYDGYEAGYKRRYDRDKEGQARDRGHQRQRHDSEVSATESMETEKRQVKILVLQYYYISCR